MSSKGVPALPELWAVQIETTSALTETIAEFLGEAALALTVLAPPRSPTIRIEAIYGEQPDKAALTATLSVTATLHKAKLPKLHIQKVPNLDWLHKVAADFPPLPIARWIIYGAQHRASALVLSPNHRLTLQIDATNAFGTGEHPTTRGCLVMLDQILKKNRKGRHMLDMGCGSGILAMAWAKAHPGRASGVDCDPLSVRIAKNNAQVNGLQGRIRIGQGRGYSGQLVRRNAPYDLIMANIFARPLAVMAKDLKRNLRPGGFAILSGLLTHQANLVLAAHRMQKIYPVKCFRIGDWSVLVLKRSYTGTS